MRIAVLVTAVIVGMTSFSAAIPKALEHNAVENSAPSVSQVKRTIEESELKSATQVNLDLVPLRPV